MKYKIMIESESSPAITMLLCPNIYEQFLCDEFHQRRKKARRGSCGIFAATNSVSTAGHLSRREQSHRGKALPLRKSRPAMLTELKGLACLLHNFLVILYIHIHRRIVIGETGGKGFINGGCASSCPSNSNFSHSNHITFRPVHFGSTSWHHT
jgi:hypothetical protein